MSKDFYTILGIPRTANDEEVKKAYKKLALRYHPDKNKDKNAEDNLKEIAQAYEVLTDKKKRDTYDRFGEDGLKQGCQPTNKLASKQNISVWSLRTHPKLFVKPTIKSNLVIIQNAIMKVLEGAHNAKTLRRMQNTISIHSKTCVHFLISFRNRLQFRALYSYDEKQNQIFKLDGVGPKSIDNEDISNFYKFDSPKREFVEVQTRQISLTIIGFVISDHVWSKFLATRVQSCIESQNK